jgi:hypothetical protein
MKRHVHPDIGTRAVRLLDTVYSKWPGVECPGHQGASILEPYVIQIATPGTVCPIVVSNGQSYPRFGVR